MPPPPGSTPLNLYASQARALRAQGRELLIHSQPAGGGTTTALALALVRASSHPSERVTVVVPDFRRVRQSYLEGRAGLWTILRDAAQRGAVRLRPGPAVEVAGGGVVEFRGRDQPLPAGTTLVIVDDLHTYGWAAWVALVERVLAVPPPAGASPLSPRAVGISQRVDGWIREHWQADPESRRRTDLDCAELPPESRLARAEPAAVSFRDFCTRIRPRQAWHYHSALIAETLQAVIDEEIENLLVMAPPRHFKSEYVSRHFPAYVLHRFPELWVGLGASTASLARELSKEARSRFAEGGGLFRLDSKDAMLWRTELGGGCWARGIGGTLLGFGWNYGIVDDPFRSRMDALRLSKQEATAEWCFGDFSKRHELLGPRHLIVNHQRLCEGDLADRIMGRRTEQGWHVLCLQAIKRKRIFDFPDWMTVIPDDREEGTALAPALQNLEELAQLEREDADLFAALQQQEPRRTLGGGMFLRDFWAQVGDPDAIDRQLDANQRITAIIAQQQQAGALPAFWREVRAWDIAASVNGRDQTAAARLGVTNTQDVIYTDVIAERVGSGAVEELILSTAELDGPGVEIVLPQDPAAMGKLWPAAMAKKLRAKGYRVEVITMTDSKRARAALHAGAARPLGNGLRGRVSLMYGRWNDLFIEQHFHFTGEEGRLDDIVDAAAVAFNQTAGGATRQFLGWRRAKPGEPDSAQREGAA